MSPESFWRVWQSGVLVLFFCEPPILLHGFVQSGIWHDHFKTTIMNANFELPSYECFLLDTAGQQRLGNCLLRHHAVGWTLLLFMSFAENWTNNLHKWRQEPWAWNTRVELNNWRPTTTVATLGKRKHFLDQGTAHEYQHDPKCMIMYAIKLNAFKCCVFRCRWVWLVGPMLSLWSQKRPNLCLQNLARLPDRWMFKTVRLGSLKRFLILQVHRVDDKRWSKWGTIAAKWWHNVDT